jgi:cytochrome c-type biogenesis protein
MVVGNIGLGLAFLAGLASFLSPCVLSLVPAYISYLGGRTAGSFSGGQSDRWHAFRHGVAFVLGFSVIFVLLGITTSAIGNLLYDARDYIAKIGGIIVVIFGIHMTGIIRIPLFEYDTRRQDLPNSKYGYLSSALMGIFFSAGWSPCVGPVLGAILTFTLSGGSILQGATMLTFYSAGLAIPFLLAALGIGWVTLIIKKYSKVMRWIEITMGVFLIVIGIMLFMGTFEQLARFGFFVDFGL